MAKVTLEVELPDELAEFMEELLKDDPKYFQYILAVHLSRKKVYKEIKERADVG